MAKAWQFSSSVRRVGLVKGFGSDVSLHRYGVLARRRIHTSSRRLALLCLVLALGYASAQSPPAAPTIDSVSSGDTTLTLAWTAPADATGITAYDVRHIETSADETDDANWTVTNADDAWTSGALEYTITGLTNGTEYDVQVRAVDVDDVDGAWSATTSATPADHGNDLATAKSVTAGARVWGVIDPAGDEDYFSFSVSRTSDYWIYALGDLDTVGELLDSGGMSIDINDRGGALPNPDNFFLWRKLQSGTYFIKVTGYGPTDEPYIHRVREFTDTTFRSNAATLNLNGSASGTIDPEDDDDYFKLELSETTEVAIRASGFPDTVGELQRSNGTVIASNDDGYLPGNRRNFVIRENLAAGVYYVKVSSFDERSDGPYSVYAAAITEPGSAIADAQPLTLGGTAGGIIDPAGDEDYFSLTLEETTYVIIGGVSKVTNISAALTDENDLAAPVNSVHFDDTFFFFQGRLGAGTYYLKVTGKDDTETGRYTVRAIVEGSYTYFVDRCSNISRSAGINDPLYGCQWHLNNDDQFRNSAEQDIRVEEVWPTYTGDGINVAVAVQDKCPSNCSAEMSPVWSAMVSDGDTVDATGDRRVGGFSASMYLLTVSLWIPNSLAIRRMDIPLSFACCTAFHLSCCRKVGFRGDATTCNPATSGSSIAAA